MISVPPTPPRFPVTPAPVLRFLMPWERTPEARPARGAEAGATVAVEAWDFEPPPERLRELQLWIARSVAPRLRLYDKWTDSGQAWELYRFMRQDPGRPSPFP